MFGRRRHGEKASNGKPVKKLIKTANEEIAVLGRGHTTVKSISDEVLFLCRFPHSGNPRAANPEFPFLGF